MEKTYFWLLTWILGNITSKSMEYEKLDPFLSSWQPGCESFQRKLCGKLRLNQSRACSFYERNKTTGDCPIKTSKDLQIAKGLGCVSSSEFDNVFKREHVCNFDSPGKTYDLFQLKNSFYFANWPTTQFKFWEQQQVAVNVSKILVKKLSFSYFFYFHSSFILEVSRKIQKLKFRKKTKLFNDVILCRKINFISSKIFYFFLQAKLLFLSIV